jgi:hypothetical protein
MDHIEDKDVARLWAIHYPKHSEDVKSKTLCLAMYLMITDKAQDIISYGWWEDKLLHSARYFGVPKEKYDEFKKVAKEFEQLK